jgi:hypothetical protein
MKPNTMYLPDEISMIMNLYINVGGYN